MNYFFHVRQQALLYVLFTLSYVTTYGIMCYLGWREPIILTSGHVSAFVAGTLTFVFLGPLIGPRIDTPKK